MTTAVSLAQSVAPGVSLGGTALLVMTHNVTGLKYFCKTTRLNEIHTYKGSGLHWKRHMRKHGRNVSVGVVGIYYDESRCVLAAKNFSVENKIVESSAWANLIDENGLDGAPAGKAHPMYGKPHPRTGEKRPHLSERYQGAKNPMWGKPSAMRGKSNAGASIKLKGRKRPEGGGKPAKPVICLDDGKEYASVSDAARSHNGTSTTISSCCLGKSKTAYGKRWAYKEQTND